MLKANNQPFSFHLAGTLKEKIPFLSIPIDDTKNSHGNWYIPAPSSCKTPVCTWADPKTIHTPDPSTLKTSTDLLLFESPKNQ
jgi:hypothetical protein